MNLKTCLFLFQFFIAFSVRPQSNTVNSKRLQEYSNNKVEIETYGDYRSEDFHWSIAGNSMGQNPNVLSEVKWKNIKSAGIGLDIRLNIWSPVFFKGSYQHTFIKNGTVNDTDYSKDNRTEPSYRADLNASEGFIYTYKLAAGYEFEISQRFLISLYAGYVKNSQQLHLKDFNEDTTSDVKKLNSVYQTHWTGPVIGAEANFILTNQLSVQGMIDYQQMKYKAVADWNLIDAFAHPVSFRHTANGYGTEGLIKVSYHFTPVVSAFIRGNYYYAHTGKGMDDLFLADSTELQSQFNGAARQGGGLGIGVSLRL
jgi:hypothetical protein